MVLLKGVDARGFLFFTNYESRKARELASNPHAALVFYWHEVQPPGPRHRTRIETSRRRIRRLFRDAPAREPPGRASLPAKRVIPSRRRLWNPAIAELAAPSIPTTAPPRPINWGGYCVHPDEIEFWQQGPNRLHDRLRYRKRRGAWILERLSP